MTYVFFLLLGIPVATLLDVFLIRLVTAFSWWVVLAMVFVLGVIYGFIPDKVKGFMKGVLLLAIAGFCISCFF